VTESLKGLYLVHILQKKPAKNVANQDMKKRIAGRILSAKNVERKGAPPIAVMIKLAGHKKGLRRTGSVAAAVAAAAAAAAVKVFTAKIG